MFGLGKEQFDRAFSSLTDEESLKQVEELLALATHASNTHPQHLTPAAAEELSRVMNVLNASGTNRQSLLTRETLLDKLKTMGIIHRALSGWVAFDV